MSLTALSPIFSDSIFEGAASSTQDALGNIFDAHGNHIGVVPGSIADVGSKGAGVTPSTAIVAPPLAPTTNVVKPSTTAQASNWLQKALFGIDLEDGLFIVIGLLLIAAGLYGFTAVQNTVNSFAREAGRSAMEAAA